MNTIGRARTATVDRSPAALGLRVLAVLLGVFFIAMSLNKIAWLTDSRLLSDRFQRWAPAAAPDVRWYLQTIALPLAPILARVIPIAEFCTGLALILGVWTRMAATLALFMVLNFHYGTSAFYSWEFLRDGTGPPVIGALLALAIGATSLPYCIRTEWRWVGGPSGPPTKLDHEGAQPRLENLTTEIPTK